MATHWLNLSAQALLIAMLLAAAAALLNAQSTQGLIAGRVTDSVTGRPIAGAQVSCTVQELGYSASTYTEASGYYYLPQLSPAQYEMHVSMDKYQPQEIDGIELAVAGRLEINWQVRPLSDVWEAGQYRSVYLPGSKTVLPFYGPDVDISRSVQLEAVRPSRGALDSSVSETVNPQDISDLPLAGRDVYSALVLQSGVTADTTTSRSLGLSTNGQRSSSSNFLLDGIETNNYLVSGPLSPIAPEAVQEYRISTNNFSAEYGGTSGYIANAITRAGTNRWHALAYLYMFNTALNANDFQSNLAGLPRTVLHQFEPGMQGGGPIQANKLFVSLSFDYLSTHSNAAPVTYRLPTTALLAATSPGSIARQLLTAYPGPLLPGPALTAVVRLSPPVTVHRPLGLARVDRIFSNGARKLMGRYAQTNTSRPDYQWTPFQAFSSGIDEGTRSIASSIESVLRPTLLNEARFGYTEDDLHLGRAHPEIPLLTSLDGTTLPGSTVFSRFTNNASSWQAIDNLTLSRNRHLAVLGGGGLFRKINGTLTAGSEGQYFFTTASTFASDQPGFFRISLDRQDLPSFTIPDFQRNYSLNSSYLFAQDTFRLTRRLTVNYGLRYDLYGPPVNTGVVKDALVQLGSGTTLASRFAGATLVRPQGGNEQLYSPDYKDFGPRAGFSYLLPGSTGIVLRGAWGMFYDRVYDNFWQNLRNNNFVLPTAFTISPTQTNYLSRVSSVLSAFQGQAVSAAFSDPATQNQRGPTTIFQPGIRTPYSESVFFGLQEPLRTSWLFETYYAGSLGRRLLTTDIANRTTNTGLPWLAYRANQGFSSYNGLATVARYRGTWGQFQASYTWSHSIDNQSEVLRGDYFNLSATRLTSAVASTNFSAFQQIYDSSDDRGNSDFDQRHSLVFYGVFDLPATGTRFRPLLERWKISSLGAFRSGAPFTVFANVPLQTGILNPRANVTKVALLYAGGGAAVAGGEQLLNPAAFAIPVPGTLGNTGRNEFRGPDFWNVDLSLSRSFALRFREGATFTIRAEAFNVMNHANLNLPANNISVAVFGVARFGRAAAASGLPLLSPVNDTSRQIQMVVRLQF